jgi:hypothetical protein
MASHDGNNSRVCFGSLADVTRRRAIAETDSAFLAGDARCDITVRAKSTKGAENAGGPCLLTSRAGFNNADS